MLEQLLIFTRGGLILWTCKELGNALRGSPIDTLIRSCLLEERSGAASYNYDAPGAAYTLKWTFHNELGLVFVAVYQRILHLLYVDDLLAMMKQAFSEIYDPKRTEYSDFDEMFRQIRKEAEARADDLKRSKQVGKPMNNVKKQGGQSQKAGFERGSKKSVGGLANDDGDGDAKGHRLENGHSNGNSVEIKESRVASVANGKENTSSNIGAFDVSKLQKLRSKGGKKTDTVVSKVPKADPNKKITKKNRVWDDSPPETKLDFTDPMDGNGNIEAEAADHGESMMDKEEIISSDSESEEGEEVVGNGNQPEAKKKGWFSSMFQRYIALIVQFGCFASY